MAIDIEQLTFIPESVRSEFAKPEVMEQFSAFIEAQKKPVLDKNGELLKKHSDLQEAVRQHGGLETIAALKAQADAAQKAADEAAAKSGDVDAIKKQYSEQLSAAQKKAADLEASIIQEKVSNTLSKAIREAKGVPELLEPHIQGRIKSELVDGKVKVTVLGANGAPMLNADGSEATVKDLLDEFKTSPIFQRAFEANNVGGSGAKGTEPVTGGAVNPWNPATKNLTAQMKLAQENPALAKQYAALYGVNL